MDKVYDVLIIGGGPGGYTAAMYAARAGLDTLVVEKQGPGGQMALTHWIENYPGFDEGVDGFDLSLRMQSGAQRAGAETKNAEVLQVELEGNLKLVHTTEGILRSHTVIIATGAEPRPLGIPGEREYISRGVHYCASCDGMFYRGKTVVLVGGGNSAAADALQLARYVKNVILVHRRDSLRAMKSYHQSLEAAQNIQIRYNTVVEELIAEDGIRGVRVQDTQTGQISTIPCDGLFVSIGRMPSSSLFAGQLALDEGGYIIADESTKTSLPGVYAVGDVRTKKVRQIVTATADGAVAVHEIEEYLAKN